MLLNSFSRILSISLAVCLGVSVCSAAPAADTVNDIHYQTHVSKIKPNQTLRFLQPKLCDPDVVQYSGYLDIGTNEHYFFWFFESKNDPDHSPLTVWLNGGPGCSSMVGLWQELGPCRVSADGTKSVFNPNSWNIHSNLLFFDQPDGVGFSYGTDNVYSTKDGAPLAYDFLQLFYEAFPKYSELPFHFFGESYGGHYIPGYADYILKQNKALAQQNDGSKKIIPLVSIGVGNGWTDPLVQYNYSQVMACHSSYGSVLPEQDCQTMIDNYPRCAQLVQKCYNTGENDDCINAEEYCQSNVEGIYEDANRSYYDVRAPPQDGPPATYQTFLNSQATRTAIGAQTQYVECSNRAGGKFGQTGDNTRNYAPAVADILNSGVQVLLYAGDADFICNWYGNYAWSSRLKFAGSDVYQSKSMQAWTLDGEEVGQAQQGGNLTFVRVYGAGHEVPYYKGKAALAMFENAINGKSFT
ncbi:hypothetical protein DFQ28_005689 [Apophysomyces sp. BC1034]|nr:hypothetical protein DFQ30_005825 [Apophysomyces sp. BC1015]KAG0177608.1 hypothetical protein DFQ29_004637 [Apophysomyces sp. BC1021]KAG0187894.1 hypothetical protein DFQ28_005689 [Apophysomyces sp. BC1034]